MKKSHCVQSVAASLLAVTLSLPLAAKIVPDWPASETETTAQPVPEQSQNPSGTSTSTQASTQTTPAPQDPPTAPASAPSKDDKSKDDKDKKPQPGESSKEVLEQSTKGNGGRVLGVLPNYRTTNTGEQFRPLRAKDKWLIAYHDSCDYTVFVVAAAFAGYHQLDDAHPQFHQGIEGFAKYYGTAYLDQAVGNFMTEGLFPSVLHEDPRYFRKGTGSISSRLGYSIKQIFVTRTDSGGYRFNTSEWGGNAVATAVQNAYYSDSRNARDNAINWGIAIGTDTISDVLKEFWPDVKKKLLHKSADQ